MKDLFCRFFCYPVLVCCMVLFSTACEDQHPKDEDPPWLGGDIIQTLEGEGNYTVFLELMEKANYREAFEKGLFTVFVASDSAYNAYFTEEGISSVDDLTEEEALQIFTLNVINTPRSRQQLIYDYVWNVWQEPGSELGALLFRIRTKSKPAPYKETVRYFEEFEGQTLTLEGQQKFVPLLSTDFFRDYFGAVDGSDYTYFFPNTEWTGLQWYNASIVEAEVRASNGFIYYIDRVVPKIPSLEDYLRDNQDTYGVFYDIAQRFAEYNFIDYDDDNSRTSLYRKVYRGISNIISEQGPSGDEWVYQRRNIYSAFVPNDAALVPFLENTVLQNYSSLDSVPEITLKYIIQSHLTEHFELPSKIENSFYNAFGDAVPIDIIQDVDEAKLLSNGAFYGLNRVMEPSAFSSVTGPVFYQKKYTHFLHALYQTGLLSSINSEYVEVTLFAPPNDALEEYGIRYYEIQKRMEKRRSDGIWVEMDGEEIKQFVKDHFTYKKIENLAGEGYLQMNSKTYLNYNNEVITTGGNSEDGDVTNIVSSEVFEKGVLYHLDNAIKRPKNDIANYLANNPDYTEFFDLLVQAEMVDSVEDAETQDIFLRISFLLESEEWTAFLPTNSAINAAVTDGLIPDTIEELEAFLKYHFVRNKVIFDDGAVSGSFSTAMVESTTTEGINYARLQVINSPGNLQVVDLSGQSVDVNHATANNLVFGGVVHQLDKVLLNN